MVADVLPSGYAYVSDNSGGAYVAGTGLWTIGAIDNGVTTELNITATVLATGEYINVAQVTNVDQTDIDSTPNNDVLAEDDQDQVVVTPRLIADISVTKTVDNMNPSVGATITFTVTVCDV